MHGRTAGTATLNMLKQLNLRVPQDIRLASLYDNENLVNTVPPISADAV